MELRNVIADIASAVVSIDAAGLAFREYNKGVGPFGEPQLVKLIAENLNLSSEYSKSVQTKRVPDLLIPNRWAIEFKIVRPFGDNGIEAEDWSVNLLHPYPGNVSALGDCLKLLKYSGSEHRAVVVIGYEHNPARINLDPLLSAFETIAENVLHVRLSSRIEIRREGLIHPVHQVVRVAAWQVSE